MSKFHTPFQNLHFSISESKARVNSQGGKELSHPSGHVFCIRALCEESPALKAIPVESISYTFSFILKGHVSFDFSVNHHYAFDKHIAIYYKEYTREEVIRV